MNKIEKDESTVLVINGVPYSLVQDLEPKDNGVCSKCDLKDMCQYTGDRQDMRVLCWPAGLGSSWYFVIDWDIINKKINDYLDIDHKHGRID